MTDRPSEDAIAEATLATIHAHRIMRQARAFHSATGRVSAAHRNLCELLHPSMAAGLTSEQRDKVRVARDLVKSIEPDLRELAGINAFPDPEPDPDPTAAAQVVSPFAKDMWPTGTRNVIPLRRRAASLVRL